MPSVQNSILLRPGRRRTAHTLVAVQIASLLVPPVAAAWPQGAPPGFPALPPPPAVRTPGTTPPAAGGANPSGGAGGGEKAGPVADVRVSDAGTFSVAAQQVEVGRLLELLALRSRKNIVASDKVAGTVTVNLYDVPFEQALEAVLSVNNFVSVRSGEFIYVYTRQEMQEAAKAAARREARVFVLQYLAAKDATEFIKPLLSDGGTVVARGEVQPGITPTSEDGGADDYAFSTKVVVNDFTPNLDAVQALLEELDVPPKQVRVEATILRTTVDEANAYGLDFSAVGSIDFAQVTSPLKSFDDLLTGVIKPDNAQTGVIDSFPIVDKNPTLKVGIITNDVAIFLRVLDEVTDTSVLARPTVTALNRQRAQVLIGEKVAYLSTTQTQTSTTQEVKFLDTGIKLTFRPFISQDGMIRMELHPSVSSARPVNLKVSGGGEATVPNESTQELRTNVRVKSGQTIVLGGLFREDTTIDRRQVPWLGDVPILGAIFTGQSDQVKREEIIFLLTPTVFEDKELYAKGAESLEIVEAVRVGARAGLLPFSNEQMVSDYQRQAMEAYRQGDLHRALWYADNAVRLRPNTATMIRMREAVRTGDKSTFQKQLDARLGAGSDVQADRPVAPPPPSGAESPPPGLPPAAPADPEAGAAPPPEPAPAPPQPEGAP